MAGRTEQELRGLIARGLQGCKTERKCDERSDCSTRVLLRGGTDCSGAPLHICVSHWLNSPGSLMRIFHSYNGSILPAYLWECSSKKAIVVRLKVDIRTLRYMKKSIIS